ncbi:MAG: helix-turn-helix domain-containing protein [Clostridia bacterium]|nr:helix-turn-helix domain-containing protein [Clostridia bacterium]
MEDLGNKIAEYRRRLDLTQKELGEKLNVSAQAVSKWENGQAEPDASTIKNLCGIFKISTDELLGNAPPAETAVTTATAVESAPAQSEPAQPIVERVVEQKIINGYCEMCKKPVGPNEYVVTGGGRSLQHIYCNECNGKRIHGLRLSEYNDYKRQNKRSLIFGPLIGLGAAAIFCILFMVIIKFEPLWQTGLFALGVFIGYTVFGIQVFWEDSVVPDIFFFFLKSFKMPGVIFTLDLDGIIFLILVKIGGAILGAILSILVFIFGLFFTPVASIFILPFAAIKRALEGRSLKKAAQE